MHIGILLPHWIGDVVMATPMLRALRAYYGPTTQITGIMRPYVAHVLDGTDWLDDQIFFHRQSKDPRQRMWGVARTLRQRRIDTMLVMTTSLESAALAYLSRARERVGYVRNGRGPLLTKRLYVPRLKGVRQPVAVIDLFLAFARAVGCNTVDRHLELATLPHDERIVDDIWNRFRFGNGRRVVILNTGSANSPARHWPREHFIALAKRLVVAERTAVLVICGPGEVEIARDIEQRVSHERVRSMADEDLSLGVSKACIRRAQAMVSTDSGPRHFAVAFNTPIVSLCGPIDPALTQNDHPLETVLWNRLPCAPCGKAICPLEHHGCMRDLSVELVHTAVQQLLACSPSTALSKSA